MKEKIIARLAFSGDLPITKFKELIPEIAGEYQLMLPINGVNESNVLLADGISDEFTKCLISLMSEGIIKFAPTKQLVFIFDGAEIYDLPLANPNPPKNFKGYKKIHWLPILVKQGENFPKINGYEAYLQYMKLHGIEW